MVDSTVAASKRGTMTKVEPASIVAFSTHDPYTWASGSELVTRSSGPRAPISTVPTPAANTDRTLCIAPFG